MRGFFEGDGLEESRERKRDYCKADREKPDFWSMGHGLKMASSRPRCPTGKGVQM